MEDLLQARIDERLKALENVEPGSEEAEAIVKEVSELMKAQTEQYKVQASDFAETAKAENEKLKIESEDARSKRDSKVKVITTSINAAAVVVGYVFIANVEAVGMITSKILSHMPKIRL